MISEFENLIYHPERDENDDRRPGVSFGDGPMTSAEAAERERQAIAHMQTLDGVLGLIATFEEGGAWHISAHDHEKLGELGVSYAEFQELMNWPLSKRTAQ